MKLTAILLTVFCLHAAARTQGQVNFAGKQVPLVKVFEAIEAQTEYKLAYNPAVLSGAQHISINLRNASIEEAMKEVLKDQQLQFKIVGKTIFLQKKESKTEIVPVNNAVEREIKGKLNNEKNEPIIGATINVKGTDIYTTSDEKGEFVIANVAESAILIISSINYETIEFKVKGKSEINLVLKIKTNELAEVIVPFNTGYQTIPAERATGSFTHVDQKLLERSPEPNVLARLRGVTNGLLFNSAGTDGGTKTGITIRGTSTLSALVSKDPLIVVDNFPYEGNINNINPNDIASVTILKDAAAASIWGARSGNGVIVITTKKGIFNRKMSVEANMNVTVGQRPDLYYDPKYVQASAYIGIERFLFDKGFYNQPLNDKVNYPSVSPVVELLNRHKAGQINTSTLNTSLDSLGKIDLRPQAEDNIYRNSVAQQYSVNVTGGSQNIAYYLGLGYDFNNESLDRNNRQRFSITSINTFTPVKNLEIVGSMIYTTTKNKTPNTIGWGNTLTNVNRHYPYASLVDESGNPVAIHFGYRRSYTDSLLKMGFLDWRYRPLEELALANNETKINSITLRASAKYNFTRSLNLNVQFQSERQNTDGRQFQQEESYAVRTMINRFSQYNPSTKIIAYPFPRGGILRNTVADLISNNLRAQLSFAENWGDHSVNALAGAEVRETKLTSFERLSYGYSDRYGSSASIIDYVTRFKTNGGPAANIPAPPGNTLGTTQRFISYFANAAYSYRRMYTLSISGRKDGANLFGVRANDRMTPLWSIGGSYEMSQENFYRVAWLPYLKLRSTYGFNGNVYSGAAYLTAVFGSISALTNLTYGDINTAPNPELRWEKVRNINFGVDFGLKKDIIRGSIEYYIKQGLDLVQDMEVAPSSGFPSYRGNSASTRTQGLELMLTSLNINRAFKWSTTFIGNYNTDKVKGYDAKIFARNLAASDFGAMNPDNYIMGMYSYKWTGIDPINGDPMGYFNKAQSKDYTQIINSSAVEDLVYHGSTRPLVFGSIRNTFSWKGFSLSANITYKLDYYFRRQTVNLNYQSLLNGGLHSDYEKRWQKPGDENLTNIPSLVYANNVNRNTFFRNSSINIERGDHIRLSDMALSYDFVSKSKEKTPFSSVQLYSFVNNIGILWKENDAGIDPDYNLDYMLPLPMTFTLGVRAKF